MEKARGKNVIFYMEDELGRPIFMEDEKLKAIKKELFAFTNYKYYTFEELVKNDPEIIFITSMGNDEAIENRLRSDVQSNPAWNSLKAVRENRIIFLPEQLFLINPGLQYPKAVEYMAKTVYPEVFTNAK